jgi:hypothetical protein
MVNRQRLKVAGCHGVKKLLTAAHIISHAAAQRIRHRQHAVAEVILALVVGLLAVVSLAFGLVKLFLMPGGQLRSLGSLERSLARSTSPTKRPSLKTEDGVRIQVVHLMKEPRRDNVVIVCHGEGRNKDNYVYVATCALLFEDCDVITFDFRGHHESGGVWTGDGSTKYGSVHQMPVRRCPRRRPVGHF